MPARTAPSVRRILNTALLLTALGMIVRASGAVKEILFARAFGVSAATDAFVLAITYATFLPMIVGGALATTLIAERAKSSAESNNGWSALAAWVLIAACSCGILVYALAAPVMSLLFALEGETLASATSYARILSPLGVTMVLALAMSGLLNSSKQFYIAGIAALATPMFTILGILIFSSEWGIEAAAWGMATGALIEAALLAIRILSQRKVFFPAGAPRERCEREWVFWRSVAMLGFAATVAALGPIIDQVFLARLDTGAVTNFSYASKINSLLIGLFGTAFGAAIYPYLSDLAAQRDMSGLKHLTWRLAAVVLPLSGATTLLVYVFSYEIVEVLFARGNFPLDAIAEVSAIQQMFAFQLVFYVAGLLTMRVLNATGAARFVLVISCIGVATTAFLDAMLYEPFGARGIALASGLTSVVSLIVALAFIKPALLRRA